MASKVVLIAALFGLTLAQKQFTLDVTRKVMN